MKNPNRLKYSCGIVTLIIISVIVPFVVWVCCCFHVSLSVSRSQSRNESISRNAFICDYVPLQDSILIDNRKICLPIKEAFAEKKYQYKSYYTNEITLLNNIQVVAVFNDTLKLSREDHGEIFIQGYEHNLKNREIIIDYIKCKGRVNLPDSIPCYITTQEREVTINGQKHYTRDTLQTFWLVKKTLSN